MVGIDGGVKLRNYSMIIDLIACLHVIDFIVCPYLKGLNPHTKSITEKKCRIHLLFALSGLCPSKYSWDSGLRITMHEICRLEIINNVKILLQCVDKYPRFV